MKRCELCDRAAKMYCESDKASLCWDCDAKVHSANFLVERHPRLLLCRRCQAPTTWRATGARLSPIISSCDRCTVFHKQYFPSSEEQDENEVDVNEADSDEDEQEDCQVVPWRPTPPPPASSSSGEESSSLSSVKARSNNSLKRIREKEDFASENDDSRPFNRRRRSRHDLFFEAPFSSRIEGNEKDHRISLVQSDALFFVDSGETGSRACARRASTAVDLISSASCSPTI